MKDEKDKTIVHNLGYRPNVNIYLPDGQLIIGGVRSTISVVEISLNKPITAEIVIS